MRREKVAQWLSTLSGFLFCACLPIVKLLDQGEITLLFAKSKGLQTDNSCSLNNNNCLLQEYHAAGLSVGTSHAYSHLIHKQPLREVNTYYSD